MIIGTRADVIQISEDSVATGENSSTPCFTLYDHSGETTVNRLVAIAVLCALIRILDASARAEEPSSADHIRAGRALSLRLCTPCHVVSADQEMAPILRPPARNFRSIANRSGTTAESLRRFLGETHRSLGKPGGMPNPQLTEIGRAHV